MVTKSFCAFVPHIEASNEKRQNYTIQVQTQLPLRSSCCSEAVRNITAFCCALSLVEKAETGNLAKCNSEVIEQCAPINVDPCLGTYKRTQFSTNHQGALIFVVVSFIILMLIVIAWLLSYYIQRFRQLRMFSRIHRRRQNLAKRAISRIPAIM